jgi:hypothetical protein
MSLLVILGFACSSDPNQVYRRGGAPMVTQVSELRGAIGKRVTVVGTARRLDSRAASIEIKSGYVDLPGYEWPKAYVDQRVQVIGTVVDKLKEFDVRNKPVYRLGEIEVMSHW